jgi:saccharopine dehydrogenase-like NADP-dependent oxidoreductase
MGNVLLLGTGKSSTVLLRRLYEISQKKSVKITVVDLILDHVRYVESEFFVKKVIDVNNPDLLRDIIVAQDIVISLMPPNLHLQVARLCLAHKKHFITASYLDEKIKALEPEISGKGLFFVNEMGLDPGIDHLLAMEMIMDIKDQGGVIQTFESYCGGLVAPESDDNPLHYKITWNPLNIVNAGKAGAKYLENKRLVSLNYKEVFAQYKTVSIIGSGNFEMYANRDSLPYIDLYGLQGVDTFVRGTLRLPGFCAAWSNLIEMGLTDESKMITDQLLDEIQQKTSSNAVKWLLANTNANAPVNAVTYLLNTIIEKLYFKDMDKDRVVLYHRIGYSLDGEHKYCDFILDRKGRDKQETAMAETVGLPLLACVELILENKFIKSGVLLPSDTEVFALVLGKLRGYGLIP